MARPPHVLINTFVETNAKQVIPTVPRAMKYLSTLHALTGGNTLSVLTHYNTVIRLSLNSVSIFCFLAINFLYITLGPEKIQVQIQTLVIYDTMYSLHFMFTSLSQKGMRKYLIEIMKIEKTLSAKVSAASYVNVPLIVEVCLSLTGTMINVVSLENYSLGVPSFALLRLNALITSNILVYLALKSTNILTHLNKAVGRYLRSLKRHVFLRDDISVYHVSVVNGVAQKVYDEVKPGFYKLQKLNESFWQTKCISVLIAANICYYSCVGAIGINHYIHSYNNAGNGNVWLFLCGISSLLAGVGVPVYQMCKSYQNIIHSEHFLRTQLQSLQSCLTIGIKQSKQLKEVIDLIDRKKFTVDVIRMAKLDLSLAWGLMSIFVQFTIALVMNVNQININSFYQARNSTNDTLRE